MCSVIVKTSRLYVTLIPLDDYVSTQDTLTSSMLLHAPTLDVSTSRMYLWYWEKPKALFPCDMVSIAQSLIGTCTRYTLWVTFVMFHTFTRHPRHLHTLFGTNHSRWHHHWELGVRHRDDLDRHLGLWKNIYDTIKKFIKGHIWDWDYLWCVFIY